MLAGAVSEWFGHPTVGPALTAAMTSGLAEEQSDAVMEENADALRLLSSMAMRQYVGFLSRPIPDGALERVLKMSETFPEPFGA